MYSYQLVLSFADNSQPPERSGGALVATEEGVVLPGGSEVTGPVEAVGLSMLRIVD